MAGTQNQENQSGYPQHNLTICLHRPQGAMPNLKARRIKSNGVVDVAWRNQGDSLLIHVERLQDETFRITWG